MVTAFRWAQILPAAFGVIVYIAWAYKNPRFRRYAVSVVLWFLSIITYNILRFMGIPSDVILANQLSIVIRLMGISTAIGFGYFVHKDIKENGYY